MEFLKRLKALIPTVSARESNSETDTSDSTADEVATVATGSDEVRTDSTKPTGTYTTVDLSKKPGAYSDVLVKGNPQYEYFPEREFVRYRPKFWKRLMMIEGREEFTRLNCERNLYELMKEEPLIKLMLGALKSVGCEIDVRRNFSCEVCYAGVYGGYDTETHQVLLCMNNVNDKKLMATILTHELIHMFDHCVNKTDFKSPEHLACTEIRAINLTSCSLVDSFFSGFVSPWELVTKAYSQKHAVCVKEKALKSVLAASSHLSEEEARKIIDQVFPYCYNDLEPIGRRLRHRSSDGDRAFFEGTHYGYV